MNFGEKAILGFVQSLLEWLPVSSQGFIILIAINVFGESAEVALRIAIYFHLGTALAVLIKYRNFYIDALMNDRTKLRYLVYATIGTALTGVPLYFLLKEIFTDFNGMIVTLLIGITLLVTATLLRMGRIKQSDKLNMDERSVKDEILVGCVQGCAILPGISRSGSTLTYLILRGYNKEDAFHMSFVISLPAVAASIVFDMIFEDTSLIFDWENLIIVLLVAVVGYITMDLLLRFARKVSFDYICYLLGIITLVLASIFIAANPSI